MSKNRTMESVEKFYHEFVFIVHPCNGGAFTVHVQLYTNAEITAEGLHRVLR